MLEHLQHGGHELEVVISRRLYGTYQDRVKIYFIGSAHNKSDGMCVHDVQQLVRYRSYH